jgi:hypothetical protein
MKCDKTTPLKLGRRVEARSESEHVTVLPRTAYGLELLLGHCLDYTFMLVFTGTRR